MRRACVLFLRCVMPQSAELETLDQLLGGEMSLTIIRRFYASPAAFAQGVYGLLQSGDVRLLSNDHSEIPRWQWRRLFEDGAVIDRLDSLLLDITEQGGRKISRVSGHPTAA